MKFLRNFLTGTLITAGFITMIGIIVLLFWQFIKAFDRLILNPSWLNLVIFLILSCVGCGLYCAFELLGEDKEGR